VKCIVTCGEERFHNLRLFVRLEQQWKLLGWANERLTGSTSTSGTCASRRSSS
jgi:hypothetical protein